MSEELKPFEIGQIWENPDGRLMVVNKVSEDIFYTSEDNELGWFSKKDNEIIDNIELLTENPAKYIQELRQEVERLRALTEWKPIETLPTHTFSEECPPIYLVEIQHCRIGDFSYVCGTMLEDGFYLSEDGGELSRDWDIVRWKPISAQHIEGK